ncbi:MAG: hypothetical protein M3247_01145 [Thermoproteota archaeon]|jgi:hypothetical protein|nr:hypothetical protein [Thermoproteota archaeon]
MEHQQNQEHQIGWRETKFKSFAAKAIVKDKYHKHYKLRARRGNWRDIDIIINYN